MKLPSWKSEEIPLFYPWQTNYTLLRRQKALPLFVGNASLNIIGQFPWYSRISQKPQQYLSFLGSSMGPSWNLKLNENHWLNIYHLCLFIYLWNAKYIFVPSQKFFLNMWDRQSHQDSIRNLLWITNGSCTCPGEELSDNVLSKARYHHL